MDETIKAIQTRDGPKQIDYTALANKPVIPAPEAKSADMTQAVGMDANGLLWTAPGGGGGGASSWSDLTDKPFEMLGETLQVENGVLNIVIPPEYGRVSYNGFELTIE